MCVVVQAVREALESLFQRHVSVAQRLQAIHRGRIGRRIQDLLRRQYAVMMQECERASVLLQVRWVRRAD
jgi:hypothetical protein